MNATQPAGALQGTGAYPERLDSRMGVIVFLIFAGAYFCSTLVRAIIATLAPVLTKEFSLHARDLGLLSGGYFLGFAVIQLPLGKWLDKYGPRRVSICFLSLAVLGCVAFSLSTSFTSLLAARIALGMGVGACLMAPLTGYRRWFDSATLLRANSWMLMTGSLGMLTSTLPVQWLVPLIGWRPLFWILAALISLAMAAIAWFTPAWPATTEQQVGQAADLTNYAEVWKNPYFRKMLPIGFFNYGGMIAMQTLWAGPWMIQVAGYTPLQAAMGLFFLNACMLTTFCCWGIFNPWLNKNGWRAGRLITCFAPASMLVLALNIWAGGSIGWIGWALFCVTSSVMGLAQPAVGMAFRPALAGRALSAYNLGIFGGVFVVQWGIGLLLDLFVGAGLSASTSFRSAMAVFLCCCIASYAYFVSVKADNLILGNGS